MCCTRNKLHQQHRACSRYEMHRVIEDDLQIALLARPQNLRGAAKAVHLGVVETASTEAVSRSSLILYRRIHVAYRS